MAVKGSRSLPTATTTATTTPTRMTSPVRCMHPECLATSSGDEAPRCLKLQTQLQSLQRTPTTPTTPTSAGRHIKLRCNQCNDYPDGFRSEHELRRHTNRVHKGTRKVWITVDASPDQSFLANCKSCQSGKKYNECYNAASHLRRMHFHPRKRGEGKGEKRGGAGSVRSEDPPMEVLKKDWLREVDMVVGEGSEEPRPDDESYTDSKMDTDPEPADGASSDTSPTQ